MPEIVTQDKRREILDAAARVIATKGLCDTRIADVADVIGVSPALIIYYFETKEALLAESLSFQDRQFHVGLAKLVDGEGSARSRLRTLIEYSCPDGKTSSDDAVHWLLWFDLWSRSRLDASMAEERAQMDARYRDVIVHLVENGRSSGEFRDIDPERFALELSALIDGLGIQVLLGDPHVTPQRMLETVLAFAERNLI